PSGRLWLTSGGEVQGRELPDGRLAASWSSEGVRRLTGSSDPLCVAAGRRWVAAGGDNGCVYLLRADNAALAVSPLVSDSPVRADDAADAQAGTLAGDAPRRRPAVRAAGARAGGARLAPRPPAPAAGADGAG